MARPLNRFVYKEADLADLASAYAFGIARNHPFIDGNKRTAFAAFIVLLGLNGIDFKVPPPDATAIFLALAAGETSEEAFTRWVRDH